MVISLVDLSAGKNDLHLQDATVLLLGLCNFQSIIFKVVQDGDAADAILLLSALGDRLFEVPKPPEHLEMDMYKDVMEAFFGKS